MSFETFNQYRKSRSISNESDASLTQNVFKERDLSRSTSREKRAASVTKKIVQLRSSTTISSLQVLQMLFRWLIIMSASKISRTSFFDEYNVIEFLNRYVDLCQNYDLEKEKKIRRLFRYCDFINEQYVRVVVNANVFDWKEFYKTLCKNYKNKNLNQQLHSLEYLEVFKNKMRTFLKEISQYCRQYTIISEKLIKTEKLQKTLRSAWFLQRLFEKFNEKLVIRCSLNENDENKMRVENLIKQILQLIKSRSVIIKTRKTNYKTKKTTTLMKEMKSIMKKNVSEHFINLLKAMKSRIEESISKIDVKLDDLIKVMKKMTINVDNLINCVFFLSDRDNSESSQDY
jgi:CRISPR/Cas system-associated protein Cas5 (RAMP superfamily)